MAQKERIFASTKRNFAKWHYRHLRHSELRKAATEHLSKPSQLGRASNSFCRKFLKIFQRQRSAEELALIGRHSILPKGDTRHSHNSDQLCFSDTSNCSTGTGLPNKYP
jgi:hypothetical protein